MKIFKNTNHQETISSHEQEIWKKVLIPSGQVPSLTQYAQARFMPGQEVEQHSHSDMYEIFFVVQGKGKIIVNNEEHEVFEETVFIMEPGDKHSVVNDGDKDLVLQYFGILVK